MNLTVVIAGFLTIAGTSFGIAIEAIAQESSTPTEYYVFEDEIVTPEAPSTTFDGGLDSEESVFSNGSSQDLLAVPNGGWNENYLEKQQEKHRQDQAVIDDLDNMFQPENLWSEDSAFKEDVLRTKGAYIYGGAKAIESMTGLPLTENNYVQEQRDNALYGPEGSLYREHYGGSEDRDDGVLDEGFGEIFDSILDF